MTRLSAKMAELDAAVAGLATSADSPATMRPRRGIVPISEQVRAVAAGTAEAYDQLRAAMEAAVAESRLIVEIDPAQIGETAWRDRDDRSFADQAFLDLVASIESEGQLTPVALRRLAPDAYEVVFGHRRVRACRALGRTVRAILVEDDDRALVRRMIVENAVRRDLSAIEKARAWSRLIATGLVSRQELAALLKVTPQQVSNVTTLSALPDDVLEILGDWRELAINVAKRLAAALAQAPDGAVPPMVAREVRESSRGVTGRAELLIARLANETEASVPGGQRIVRDQRGRKLARLGRSGRQLVLRFQPDLDERLVHAIIDQLPDLFERVGSKAATSGENAL